MAQVVCLGRKFYFSSDMLSKVPYLQNIVNFDKNVNLSEEEELDLNEEELNLAFFPLIHSWLEGKFDVFSFMKEERAGRNYVAFFSLLDFLGMEKEAEELCKATASAIKGMSVEEMRIYFDKTCDFSKEEEEKIASENKILLSKLN